MTAAAALAYPANKRTAKHILRRHDALRCAHLYAARLRRSGGAYHYPPYTDYRCARQHRVLVWYARCWHAPYAFIASLFC